MGSPFRLDLGFWDSWLGFEFWGHVVCFEGSPAAFEGCARIRNSRGLSFLQTLVKLFEAVVRV